MATIEKRETQDGKTSYRVKVRLKGYPVQTATFTRLTDAKKWVQDTESAIREGRHFKTTEAKRHTLGELVDRYTRDVLPAKQDGDKQAAQLAWWKEQLGAYSLADITPALLAEYRDQLAGGITCRGTQRNPATVVRYMAALSHAFTIAVKEWQWLDDSPMRKVTKPKESRGRVRFLSDDERARLLTACKESSSPYLYPVVVLALSTGMRQGEVMGLTWDDIDLARGRAILHETKNGDRRDENNPAIEKITRDARANVLNELGYSPRCDNVKKHVDERPDCGSQPDAKSRDSKDPQHRHQADEHHL